MALVPQVGLWANGLTSVCLGQPCVPVPGGAAPALGSNVMSLFQASQAGLSLRKSLREFTVCLEWSVGTWECAYCSGGCFLGPFLRGVP